MERGWESRVRQSRGLWGASFRCGTCEVESKHCYLLG